MQVFAFLYRPTRSLSPAELADRGQQVRQWSLEQHDAGRVLTVSVFDDGGALLAHDGATGEASALAGCTLVNAIDLDAALALARGFPGRAFGTDVEVRPVKTFVPPPVAQ